MAIRYRMNPINPRNPKRSETPASAKVAEIPPPSPNAKMDMTWLTTPVAVKQAATPPSALLDSIVNSTQPSVGMLYGSVEGISFLIHSGRVFSLRNVGVEC